MQSACYTGRMNILLLTGGDSNEREVALRSGQAVSGALDALGYQYTVADPSDAGFDIAAAKDYDVVFLALHGRGYEDGNIQQRLEDLGVPYTGSDPAASALCFDKWKFKHYMRGRGINVTGGQLVNIRRLDEKLFEMPYVLKPRAGGSSLETHIVRKPSVKNLQVSKQLLETHTEMLLEGLVEGTEITVGILGDEPLPVIEIIPPEGREFDYANKYNGLTQELCPPLHVSEKIQNAAKKLALNIHKLAGCRDMSRTDMIVDATGKLHVIETNTIPGLTAQSLLPKMAQAAGLSMPEFVDKLLGCALSRQP